MGCTLSARLSTPQCNLSSWEHRGLGVVSSVLEHAEFKGEGGGSQGVHRQEGNLNQKTTVHKTTAHCLKSGQF